MYNYRYSCIIFLGKPMFENNIYSNFIVPIQKDN